MKTVRRKTMTIGLAVAVLATSAQAVQIVFDPKNLAVNIEQVLHHLEVIDRLEQQIRNQFRMLQNWRFTRLDELLASMKFIRKALDEAGAINLAGLYPIVAQAYAPLDANAVQFLKQQWLDAERGELIHAQTLQNRAVAAMAGTQRRVDAYVQRSNAAPGQTAVLQATNETLATMTGQLQSLQALDVAQARMELEEEAHRQAESALFRQRREALMKDWPVSTELRISSTAIRSPLTTLQGIGATR